MSFNETRLGNLPPVTRRQEFIPAKLVTQSGVEYEFLYNPEVIEGSKSAKYSQANVPLWAVQPQQYQYTEGTEKKFGDLLLDGWSAGKSIKPIIEEIQLLMEADVENGRYSPVMVTFTWGEETFGPAVITDLSWTESAWLNGIPGFARMNINLKQVPLDNDNAPDYSKTTEVADPNANSSSNNEFAPIDETSEQPLTDRQKEEAKEETERFLGDNLDGLDPDVRQNVLLGDYVVEVEDSGDVNITDGVGGTLGRIGRWNPNLGSLLDSTSR